MSKTTISKGEIDKGGDLFDKLDRIVNEPNPSNGVVPTINITDGNGNEKVIEYNDKSERDKAFEKMSNP